MSEKGPKKTTHVSNSFSKGKVRITRTVTRTDENGNTFSSTSSGGFNIAGFIVLVLLVYAAVSVLTNPNGAEVYTFRGFLEMLQSVPEVDFSWIAFIKQTITLPYWLSWLQGVVTVIQNVISVLGFLFTGLMQAVAFIVYFLGWLF